jgi:hypothetical protein
MGALTSKKYLEDEEEWFTGTGGSTPKQYGIPNGAKELQDLIEYRNMNFSMGNIFKAVYRLGIKNKDEYELEKILFFANRELKRIKKLKNE